MGSYNSQYESYYSSISRKNKGYSHGGNSISGSSGSPSNKNFIIRRVFQELIGVFVLIIFVLFCKTIKTPQTNTAYSYAKTMVNYNCNYNDILSRAKNIKLQNLQDEFESIGEKLRIQVMGGESLKESIQKNFIVPLSGKISVPYGEYVDSTSKKKKFSNGIVIEAADGSEIKCSGDGNVTEVGSDKSIGNYIVVNHGDGLETKYGNLKEVKVKKGDKVKKGGIIALCGNGDKTKTSNLYFELLFMGQNKDPEEYLNFAGNL